MKKHYECAPFPNTVFKNLPILIFDWDEETGEITGRDKAYFDQFEPNEELHIPMPWPGFTHVLSDSPFTSKQDMAAMIFFRYQVPDDLKKYRPRCKMSETPKGGYIYYYFFPQA